MSKTFTPPAGDAVPPPSVVDLEGLIRDLQESGIYAGVQASNHGLAVWICGKSYTVRVDDVISTKEKAAAAYWLHIQALRLFPESTYAQRWERQISSRVSPPATLKSAAPKGPGFAGVDASEQSEAPGMGTGSVR